MIARAAGDDQTLLSTLARRFLTIVAPDTLDECLANSGEQLALAERLDDPIGSLFAAVYRERVPRGRRHRRRRCRDHHREEVSDVSTAVPSPPGAHHASVAGVPRRGIRRGRTARHAGIRDRRQSGVPEARSTYAAQIFAARETQGRLDELLPQWERYVNRPDAMAQVKAVLCMAYCRLGRTDDARATFDRIAPTDLPRLSDDRYGLIAMAGYAEICEYLDERPTAQVLLEWMRPWHHQVSFSMATTLGSVPCTSACCR